MMIIALIAQRLGHHHQQGRAHAFAARAHDIVAYCADHDNIGIQACAYHRVNRLHIVGNRSHQLDKIQNVARGEE